jgi:hypothetical protein
MRSKRQIETLVSVHARELISTWSNGVLYHCLSLPSAHEACAHYLRAYLKEHRATSSPFRGFEGTIEAYALH